MSADDTPPSPSEPPPPPPDEPSALDPLPHKRRYKKSGFEDDDSTGSDHEIIILSSLLKSLLNKGQDSDAKPEQKSNSKIKRLGTKTAPPTPASSESKSTEGTAATENIAGVQPTTAPPVLPKLTPRPFRPQGDDHWGAPAAGRGRGILYFAFTALVALAAFLIGRSEARHDASKAPAVPIGAWTAVPMGRLDQALAADQAGDLLRAEQLATDLKNQMRNAPAMDVYLQSLETRRGKTNDVESTLSHALQTERSPMVDQLINRGLAFNYARARDFARAGESFAAVTEADPFTAANFYYWGDSLRRAGSMPEAIAKFRQTLLRLPPDRPELESERECAEYKLCLSLIEMGRESEIRPAIDEHLRAPAPSGYWLLTAGAAALQQGDFAAAADALRKARTVLSATMYSELTDDYFFHAYSYRSELASLIPTEKPADKEKRTARTAFFVDP